jgi:hypothetical protein
LNDFDQSSRKRIEFLQRLGFEFVELIGFKDGINFLEHLMSFLLKRIVKVVVNAAVELISNNFPNFGLLIWKCFECIVRKQWKRLESLEKNLFGRLIYHRDLINMLNIGSRNFIESFFEG